MRHSVSRRPYYILGLRSQYLLFEKGTCNTIFNLGVQELVVA